MPQGNTQPHIVPKALGHAGHVALIVTHSPAEVELFHEAGSPLGFSVTTCQDYWQAGWELTCRHHDLALIDIDLVPALGLEWLSRLLAIAPDLPIIALSGDSSREREIAARNRGIAFYFIRPAEPRDLAAIFQHIAHKKTQSGPENSPTAGEKSICGDISGCGWKALAARIERRKKGNDRRGRSST